MCKRNSFKRGVVLFLIVSLMAIAAAAHAEIYRKGDTGSEVSAIQTALKKLNLYSGDITGHYGALTEKAVRTFQKKYKLEVDGLAGESTRSKLYQVAGTSGVSDSEITQLASSSSSSSSSSGKSSSSDGMLKMGDKSEDVRTLQQNLKLLGYYKGSITGSYGKLTKEAVAKFQRANKLTADGIAGTKTLEAVRKKVLGSGSTTGVSESVSTSTQLMSGSKGDDVKKLQNMLKTLGYFTGNATGNYGELTKSAVIAFQKAKGLTADGIAGSKTIAAINADYNGTGTSSANLLSKSSASKVLYENFYNWRTRYSNGEYCTVYDFSTGLSWKLRIMTKDKHMDAEPASEEDTAIMQRAFGNQTTWTPKAVWVTFSDGRTYMGSTHDVPHGTQHLTKNNFKGHLCVHFPLNMKTAESIGDYAVSHQKAINEGWEKTQKMY